MKSLSVEEIIHKLASMGYYKGHPLYKNAKNGKYNGFTSNQLWLLAMTFEEGREFTLNRIR